MSSIISQIRKSKNKILQTEAKDLQTWGKLKHCKTDLEVFLNYNLAEIQFKGKDGKEHDIICTSNAALIKIFSLKKTQDKQKVISLKSQGIKTKESTSVDSWDLKDNKLKTISLSSWQIVNFISISEENILLLDQILHDLLKA